MGKIYHISAFGSRYFLTYSCFNKFKKTQPFGLSANNVSDGGRFQEVIHA